MMEKQLQEISYKLDVLIENIKKLDNRMSQQRDVIYAIVEDVDKAKKDIHALFCEVRL